MGFVNDSQNFAFSSVPPPRRRATAKIRRVKPGETLRCIILDSSITGVITHYISGRTKPCLRSKCPCRKPDTPIKPYWKGYVMAHSANDGKLVILELTPECVNTNPILSRNPDFLRGYRISLQREGLALNSPVRAHLDPVPVANTKPAALNVFEALARVWYGTRRGEQKRAAEWFSALQEPADVTDETAPDLYEDDLPAEE